MSRRDICHMTLLVKIKRGDIEGSTDMLLNGNYGDLEVQEEGDGTPLFWAALRGYTLLVELLLTFGARVNSKSRASGGTPLHSASDNGRQDVVKLLLKWGANVSERNYFRDTPCHLAAYRGHAKIVSQLLKSGTDCTTRNSRSNTVLDEAKCGQYTIKDGEHTLTQYLINSHLTSEGDLYNDLSLPHQLLPNQPSPIAAQDTHHMTPRKLVNESPDRRSSRTRDNRR